MNAIGMKSKKSLGQEEKLGKSEANLQYEPSNIQRNMSWNWAELVEASSQWQYTSKKMAVQTEEK